MVCPTRTEPLDTLKSFREGGRCCFRVRMSCVCASRFRNGCSRECAQGEGRLSYQACCGHVVCNWASCGALSCVGVWWRGRGIADLLAPWQLHAIGPVASYGHSSINCGEAAGQSVCYVPPQRFEAFALRCKCGAACFFKFDVCPEQGNRAHDAQAIRSNIIMSLARAFIIESTPPHRECINERKKE